MGRASAAKRARRTVWEPFVFDHLVTAADEKYEMYTNNLYVVLRREVEAPGVPGDVMVHLSIRRRDRGAARDWRHFQRIKNELCGPEAEGVELYPAESRLMDGANQFHLWVLPEAAESRFPFGYESRSVLGPDHPMSRVLGGEQRAFGKEID